MLGTFLQLPDAGKVAAVDSTLKSIPQSLEPLVTNFKKLIETLKVLVAKEKLVVTEPIEEVGAPFFTICDIDKDAVTVRTRVWCKNEDYWTVYFNLRNTLYTALGEAGFKFASARVQVKQS